MPCLTPRLSYPYMDHGERQHLRAILPPPGMRVASDIDATAAGQFGSRPGGAAAC
ncbi:MAG: hypothetical protein OXI96_02420 [Acidimicrobiaceae bacterium]|nr:hypothetical protein [Acidimicrobiaceae bacterium]